MFFLFNLSWNVLLKFQFTFSVSYLSCRIVLQIKNFMLTRLLVNRLQVNVFLGAPVQPVQKVSLEPCFDLVARWKPMDVEASGVFLSRNHNQLNTHSLNYDILVPRNVFFNALYMNIDKHEQSLINNIKRIASFILTNTLTNEPLF